MLKLQAESDSKLPPDDERSLPMCPIRYVNLTTAQRECPAPLCFSSDIG
jgi:hypothetical protein